jgi:hypothetical protein
VLDTVLTPHGEERANATSLEPRVLAHGIRRKLPELSKAYPVQAIMTASSFETSRNAQLLTMRL